MLIVIFLSGCGYLLRTISSLAIPLCLAKFKDDDHINALWRHAGGYFTQKIAKRVADQFNTQCYEFISNPEHVKIGEPDGTFNPINEMLRIINGDFEMDAKKNTQEQSVDTNNKNKKKKDRKNHTEKKSTILTRRI